MTCMSFHKQKKIWHTLTSQVILSKDLEPPPGGVQLGARLVAVALDPGSPDL
jgi:hypothetical protein